MCGYCAFMRRRVEVHYSAGDIMMSASRIFVADACRSIFLEQSFVQRGQQKHFRWEIPYQYIVRLQEKVEDESGGSANAKASAISTELKDQVSSAAASASGGAPALLPLRNRPKTA